MDQEHIEAEACETYLGGDEKDGGRKAEAVVGIGHWTWLHTCRPSHPNPHSPFRARPGPTVPCMDVPIIGNDVDMWI